MSQLSDFAYTETTNDSKAGLFKAMCPFDVDFDETTKTAKITSPGKDIYFISSKIEVNGNLQLELGFLKGETERTFRIWINTWEGKSDKAKSAIGLSVIGIVEAFINRKLDLGGKDNFNFETFQEFATGLFSKIESRLNKVAMALEFTKDEHEYINYRLANLVEDLGDDKKAYHPNVDINPAKIRVDLILRNQMVLLVEDSPQDEEEQDLLSSIPESEDELEALLNG
jgi:hypothetical protein